MGQRAIIAEKVEGALKKVKGRLAQDEATLSYVRAVLNEMDTILNFEGKPYTDDMRYRFLLCFMSDSIEQAARQFSNEFSASFASVESTMRKVMKHLPPVDVPPPYVFLNSRPEVFYKNGILPLDLVKHLEFIGEYKAFVPANRRVLMNELLGRALYKVKKHPREIKSFHAALAMGLLLLGTGKEKEFYGTLGKVYSRDYGQYKKEEMMPYDVLSKVAKSIGYADQKDLRVMRDSQVTLLKKSGLFEYGYYSSLFTPTTKAQKASASGFQGKTSEAFQTVTDGAAVEERACDCEPKKYLTVEVANAVRVLRGQKEIKKGTARVFLAVAKRADETGESIDQAIRAHANKNDIAPNIASMKFTLVRRMLRDNGIALKS